MLTFLRKRHHRKQAEQLLITLWGRYRRELKRGVEDRSTQALLQKLQTCCIDSNSTCCVCRQAKALLQSRYRRSWSDLVSEAATTLALALFVLVFCRQMLFEHQMIPTGSMRPTLREMDHVIVSKTSYGINNPFGYGPLLIDSSQLKRGDIITLTSEKLPLVESQTRYFGIFPGKKRFVKRLVAQPGDRVWFYGGFIWVKPEGENRLLCSEQYIGPNHEYIPFHHFFGRLESKGEQLSCLHFQKPVLQLQKGSWNRWLLQRQLGGSLLPWGMESYAMARLLTRAQLHYSGASSLELPEASYYLEIAHHPTPYPTSATSRDADSPFYLHRTLLELGEPQLERLRKALYTSRFRVQGSVARRYNYEQVKEEREGIALPGVEDGIYEVEQGQAYRVGEDGERSLLTTSHPLYDPSLLPLLYNCGTNWNPKMAARATSAPSLPERYIYFDRGQLKSMGQVIFEKEELKGFEQRQRHLQKLMPFYPLFEDCGVPELDLVEQQGLVLSHDELMALGDNHAGSGDSRDFGLVPVTSVEGSPLWRFWPPSSLLEGVDAPARRLSRYDALAFAALLSLWFAWRLYRQRRLTQTLNGLAERARQP